MGVITGSLNCQNNSNLHLPIMAANQERSFIMIKPDGVHRGLVGEIIKRFEQKGFKLVAMKFMQASKEHLEEHYSDLKSKPFFGGLVQYMASGPVVPMVWEGLNVVETAKKEIKLRFKDEELTKYDPVASNWVYEDFL